MVSKRKNIYSLAATCASGLERLVAEEVERFGGREIERVKGMVNWQGNLESAYRTCLWSRCASRVFLKVARFAAPDEDSLYQGARKVDWSEQMGVDTTFAVDCSLSQSSISHSRFAALRVKDALVDRFRAECGQRPTVSPERPGLRIRVSIHLDQATLFLDLSGESLHRRGYRTDGGGSAPLKESLAAAILILAGWGGEAGPETMLLDPMCGSATLLIEGALIYGDAAPGLSRSYFGFTGWQGHDAALWSDLVDEAIAREEAGLDREWPPILGYDADPEAVAIARRNIERAGLEERIKVHQAQLAHLQRPAARGLLVTNPPYGERLSEQEEAEQLHRALGRICRRELTGWQLAVFTSNPDFADRMDLAWEARYRLYNGPLACRLLCTTVKQEEEAAFQWQLAEAQSGPQEGEEFGNRLRKNAKKMLPWANREQIRCFRLYDRDLPHFNIAVDLYEKWILVQEYAPPASIDEGLAAQRFQQSLAWIRHLFGVRRDRVFLRTRKRQRGKSQYQQQAKRRKMHVVREGAGFFLVNFSDYLDTGLFLDHRTVRLRLGREAAGKRFLNLFGYTGAATIHAALGGALSTTTVDLSATYLAWARMNLALNGFGGPSHITVQADCLGWLQERGGAYDLIFVDPPTFSNTKKEKRVFDVQRDHVLLLERAMARLAPDGLLIFSTNSRQFQLDDSLALRYQVRNISRDSIPLDFARNSRIHQCWEIRRKE